MIIKNQLCENPVHYLNSKNMFETIPSDMQQVQLGMGCFWGAERIFWKLDGVFVTSVGYSGGHTQDPDYPKTCTGTTGHAEVVHVVFDPQIINFDEILKVFFENHDPTQGNRQGNDRGSQYRSTIYTYTEDQNINALEAISRYEIAYGKAITTELKAAPIYYPAEDYHQQYLAKNPNGYCMHGPTGIVCEVPER